jgi:hypothetical protein
VDVHIPIRIHGEVLSYLSIWTTLPYNLCMKMTGVWYVTPCSLVEFNDVLE